MEKWEIDLRAKLEKELPHGLYDISSPGLKLITGKGGKIEYEVMLQKNIRKEFFSISIEEEKLRKQFRANFKNKEQGSLTEEELKTYLKEVFKTKNK